MDSTNKSVRKNVTQRKSPGARRKVSKPRKGYRRSRKWLVATLFIFALVIAGVIVVALPTVASKAPATALVKVPRDATNEMLADTLTKYFGKEYASDVLKLVRLSGRDISSRHGAYLIEKGTMAVRAQRTITHGAQTPVKLTINGFRNFDEMCRKIASKFDFSKDDLAKAATDSRTLGKYGLTPSQAMALWVDDSYEFYWTDTPDHIIHKVGDNYRRLWSEANVKKAESMGRTPAEVMIVASIADEETNQADEKGEVGRLYINRLNRGMRLQADPTVRFAVGDFTIKRVRGEHLKANSPYNTYRVAGLPPGPIRTTSARTVQSILDSEPSDYIYMCAREDFSGYHNFSSDYSTHMEYARRYQKALDDRGIQ